MPIGPLHPTPGAAGALRPASAARITGGFWAARRRTNAEVSLPQGPGRLEAAGNLANLRAAADGTDTFTGDFPFQDSDVHKWLEAASWQLAETPELGDDVDKLTELLAAAQGADGYLQTYYQVAHPDRRWRELGWGHELYCAGHLIQAAVAHHRTTGRTELLGVAERFASHVDATFGPGKKIDGVCGHPGIETALVELYRETGERRWLDLATYFVDRRGHGLLDADVNLHLGKAYWQDHTPVRETTAVTGHAVRQLYLLAGVTDLAAETGDTQLRSLLERLWDGMVAGKTYLTGGLGARHEGESFGDPFELPPDRAYAETCAAIASVHWSWRMALLTGEAKYSDLVERTLFNGFLSGVGLDGETWLYVNPLQVREDYDGAHADDQSARRTPWFRCACCPPNVMRLLASLPHYMTSGDGEGLQVHQYASGTYTAGGGTLRVETGYPWDGRVVVTVEAVPDEPWALSLRVPSWCTDVAVEASWGEELSATVAGGSVGSGGSAGSGGWWRVRRRWAVGDAVTLRLGMAPRLTRPDPRVDAVRGCVAVELGPLVYCLEGVDQRAGVRIDDLVLSVDAPLTATHHADLLGGVTVVTAGGRRRSDGVCVPLTAVPYHVWANRGAGPMRVWLPHV
ncbi:glycoside hydrolase family 127 protein [Streptomyces sp. NPDC059785]|uniref:glycoside hydrolase family 127 protein n=1 Tax=Streptomyces sp. NPDC059785 TaxID=3346945 RepID=UPI00364E0D31